MLSYYADEDSMQRPVINGLRAAGVDMVTVFETGRRGCPDEDHLVFATREGRVIFTANVKDYGRLHQQWWREGRIHAGIVALSDQQMQIGSQIAALVNLAGALHPADMRGRFEFLGSWLPRAD